MKKLFSTGHVLGGNAGKEADMFKSETCSKDSSQLRRFCLQFQHVMNLKPPTKKSLLNFYSNTENAFFLDNSSSNLIISQNILYKAFF